MLSEQYATTDENIDFSLLRRILAPYIPTKTDYLRSLQLLHSWRSATHSDSAPLVTACGDYRIPSSCYIQDTGHFNAVEFLICYNQLAYATFGHLFSEKYFADSEFSEISPACSEALTGMSLEDFFDAQLSSMLILKTTTRFKGIINAKYFTGTFSINRVKARRNTMFAETSCQFSDNNGGYAEGDILLAYQPKFNLTKG